MPQNFQTLRIWSELGGCFLFMFITFTIDSLFSLFEDKGIMGFGHDVCPTFFHYKQQKVIVVWPRVQVFLVPSTLVPP